MIHKHFKKLLNHTRALRDRVHQLSNRDDEGIHIKPPKKVESEKVLVELSMGSVAKATILIIFLYFLTLFVTEIKDILGLFLIAIFLSAALDPSVDALQRYRIPRPLSVLIIYICVLLFFSIFFSQLIPLVASELMELSDKVIITFKNMTTNGKTDIPFWNELMPYVDKFFANVDEETIVQNIQTGLKNIALQLKSIAGDTFSALTGIFKGIVNVFIVLVLTFFMSVEENNIESFLRSLFPSKYSQYIVTKTSEIKHKVGNWLSGQITLSIVMGLLTGIGFYALGIEYATTLGMVAALAEFLPMVGPTITFILGALIASNESFIHVLGVAGLCAFMQVLEGNVLIPLIMKRAVGLSPVVIIPAMLIGLKFFGIIGAILALPIATIIKIFIQDYTNKNR